MSTTKPLAQQFQPTSGGNKTLVDANYFRDAILYLNSTQATYGISAAGSNQAGATQLSSVLNQVDTATSGQGVGLPLSTGLHNTPFQWCIITNNTAVTLSVYGAKSSTDTINGVAGSTAQLIAPGQTALFNSTKTGAWFSGDITSSNNVGTFTANSGTAVTVANTYLTANSVVLFGLKTVGGTISAAPYMVTATPGTGFTVNAGGSDTSVYNYLIIN